MLQTIINARLPDERLSTISIDAFGMIKAIHEQPSLIQSLSSPSALAMTTAQLRDATVIDARDLRVLTAATDVHIHSRDPGHLEKEDWESLGKAARKGGVLAVVDMPNTSPATLDRASLAIKKERAQNSGLEVRYLLGVVEANLATLAPLLVDDSLAVAGLKIYYGPSTGGLLWNDLSILERYLPANKDCLLVFHAEDACCIAQAEQTAMQGLAFAQPSSGPPSRASYAIHSQLRSEESAKLATQRILTWAAETKRSVHIAHVSTAWELEAILAAKAKGIHVTCEVAPHHLLLCDEDYERLGGWLKVNPPVRSRASVARLRELFSIPGLVDCIATDHAPHTLLEKSLPYADCPAGIPALEFYWPLAAKMAQSCQSVENTRFALDYVRLSEQVATRPRALFGFPGRDGLCPGEQAKLVLCQEKPFTITKADVLAKCGYSPYEGCELPLRVYATIKGNVVAPQFLTL